MGLVTFKTDNMQPCIDACVKCAQACLESLSLTLEDAYPEGKNKLISILAQCAALCNTSVYLMSMGGRFIKELCQICAQACIACSEECAKHEDDYTQICGDICKRCAEECSKLIAAE